MPLNPDAMAFIPGVCGGAASLCSIPSPSTTKANSVSPTSKMISNSKDSSQLHPGVTHAMQVQLLRLEYYYVNAADKKVLYTCFIKTNLVTKVWVLRRKMAADALNNAKVNATRMQMSQAYVTKGLFRGHTLKTKTRSTMQATWKTA
jgi:hypothetical protein